MFSGQENFSEVEYCAQPKGWMRLVGFTRLDFSLYDFT